MDVDKLKAILAALEDTDVTQLTWVSGTERISLRLGHPPAPAPAMAHLPISQPAQASAQGHSAAQGGPAQTPAAASAAAAAAAKVERDKKTFTVTSPFVGTFYRAASPEAPPLVDLGTVVKKGQVLCIVEAMKLMNEIEADQAGRCVEVLAQNASPVEYGEALFRFEPV
jgi:acetyl-CoA carboxylase biotin carboxyl carrier protein